MTETSLIKLGYTKIDKLCPADFVKEIFKSTKKDFALFVSENPDLQSFFDSLEDKIGETDEEYKEMIREYMESIKDDVNLFKVKIKEIERKKKQDEKDRQKELLKQEILKEMEAEKRKAELEAKLGVKSSPKPTDEDDEANDEAIKAKEDEANKANEKSGITFKSKLKLKDIEPKDKNKDNTLPPLEPVKPTTMAQPMDQGTMDLGLFFAFLKEVVKNDLLIIKSDQGRMIIKDLDLDDDKIRVKVAQS